MKMYLLINQFEGFLERNSNDALRSYRTSIRSPPFWSRVPYTTKEKLIGFRGTALKISKGNTIQPSSGIFQ